MGDGLLRRVFAASFAGAHDQWARHRAVPVALVVLTGWSVLYSAWLT